MDMTLRVYNTATRSKEDFIPLDPAGKRVKVYVCGVTVYDTVHLGHARSYVAHDTIRRYLEWSGYKVKYVQNFTDIDDRIIARAAELGLDPSALAEQQIGEYFADMARLNIKQADVYPRATNHIPQMLKLVSGLIDKGYAYVAEPAPEALEGSKDVFFSIEQAGDRFGSLTNQSLEEMQAGARVEVDPRKRHPADFALWKGAKPGEPTWESPWGPGRPGWHIECSAMSLEHLGTRFDIHGGGRDLIFPHHEAEILQSECYTGVHPVVKYWMHNGFVNLDSEKMSKSLGNFFTLKEILARFDPMVVRFFLLNTHYRSPIDFSDAHLDEARTAYERLTSTLRRLKEALTGVEAHVTVVQDEALLQAITASREAFKMAMDDDLNSREAISALFELARLINRSLADDPLPYGELLAALNTFEELGGEILGLFATPEPEGPGAGPWKELADGLIDYLFQLREKARQEKDWNTADSIRDKLNQLGVVVEDSTEGASWRLE